jgi:ABC-2 type transport system ATP-binding protein
MGEIAIEIEEVWKTFRIFHSRNTTLKQAVTSRRKDNFEDFWALQDVSFSIPSGTTFGIVGANGAGKSTLLKILARILVPDRGQVVTHGRVAALLELGAGFHPELSGRENVFLNGSILGMGRQEISKKFDEIVAFSGLERFIDNPIKTYSSGMHARLGFSVAVAVEPDILLVDEVLAVGDEQFQRRCAEKMEGLRSGGRTVIYVSHSLGHMQQVCDHAVWLREGRVEATGSSETVVDAYLSSVTTAFRIDARGRQRSGTGEIELEVDLLVDGRVSTGVYTDCELTIRFLWKAHAPNKNVTFGWTIRNTEGVAVCGSVSHLDVPIDRLDGSGRIDHRIPRLALLPGSYHLAAAVMDSKTGAAYDQSPHIAEFDVGPSAGHASSAGLIDVGGSWSSLVQETDKRECP